MSEIASPVRLFVAVYGLAHGCKSLVWHASEFLFLFFLTEAVGLEPLTVAWMFGGSLALNAAMDVAVGWRLQKVIRTSLDAARLQLVGAGLVAVSLVVFGMSGELPRDVRLAFAIMAIIAFRLAYPLLDNPQNTMLALASQNGGRAQLAATRFVTGGIAKLALAITFGPMMIGQPMQAQSIRFLWLAVGIAALMMASAGALYMLVNRYPATMVMGRYGTDDRHRHDPIRLLSMTGLCLVALILSASMAVFGRLEPYLAAFGVRDVVNATTILSAVAVGAIVSQIVWAWIAQAWNPTRVLLLALITMAIGSLCFGVFAKDGALAAAAFGFIYGVGSGGTSMAIWTLLAGLAGERRSRSGATMFFGMFTGFSKAGLVIATVSVGTLLGTYDYRTQSDAMGPVLIVMTVAPVVGALAILAVAFVDQRLRGGSRSKYTWVNTFAIVSPKVG